MRKCASLHVRAVALASRLAVWRAEASGREGHGPQRTNNLDLHPLGQDLLLYPVGIPAASLHGSRDLDRSKPRVWSAAE